MHDLVQITAAQTLPKISLDQADAWLADPEQIDLDAVIGGIRHGLAYFETGAMLAGVALCLLKRKFPHGQWLITLAEQFPDLPERTARLYMRRAKWLIEARRAFPGKSAALSDLPAAHVDVLLRLPTPDRDALLAKRGPGIAGLNAEEIRATTTADFAARLGISDRRRSPKKTEPWLEIVGLWNRADQTTRDQVLAFIYTSGACNEPAALYRIEPAR